MCWLNIFFPQIRCQLIVISNYLDMINFSSRPQSKKKKKNPAGCETFKC